MIHKSLHKDAVISNLTSEQAAAQSQVAVLQEQVTSLQSQQADLEAQKCSTRSRISKN